MNANKQEYADKYSLKQWQFLCKDDEFCKAFWLDFYNKCDEIAEDLIGK